MRCDTIRYCIYGCSMISPCRHLVMLNNKSKSSTQTKKPKSSPLQLNASIHDPRSTIHNANAHTSFIGTFQMFPTYDPRGEQQLRSRPSEERARCSLYLVLDQVRPPFSAYYRYPGTISTIQGIIIQLKSRLLEII